MGQREKPFTPNKATDARIGEEETNRKQKEEQKKETGSGALTQLPGRLLRPVWIIRWAYSEPPHPQGGSFGKSIFYIFFLIYLLITLLSNSRHCGIGTHKCWGKREGRKRKGIEAERVKPSTTSQATDVHLWDEEQKGNRAVPQPSYSGPYGLTTHMDHTVGQLWTPTPGGLLLLSNPSRQH